MKKTTQIIGIFYGKSKTGKEYRVLYLIEQVCAGLDATFEMPYRKVTCLKILYRLFNVHM